MVTHARDGIFKPNPKYALTGTSPVSAVPQSVRVALRDPHWRDAMQQEFDALLRNKTWTLVPRPPDARVLSGKWVWKIKMGPTARSSVAKLVGSCVVIVSNRGSTSATLSPQL